MTASIETDTTTHSGARALRGLASGGLFLAGDPGYDEARTPWNRTADQRPAAVALPHSHEEVAALVTAAGRAGLRVAAQSTGHAAGPLAAGNMSDVVLVRTSHLDRVHIDLERGTARVGGGATWEPLVAAAAPYALAALHGSAPDVGIAGYTLGGGLSWYARKLGLACNSVTAVELVTADGSMVRADATTEPELFWALRGGGGNFGVVTSLEFRLHPIGTAYAGWLAWDIIETEKVLRRWAAWTAGNPDHVSTAFRVLRLPPVPEIPEPLRGRELAVVDGAVLGSDEQAEALLGVLRAQPPEMDTFARVPAAALLRLHQDPEGGVPFRADHTLLDTLPESAIQAFVAEVGPGVASPLLVAELRELGGQVGRPAESGGALSHLAGAYAAFAGGMTPTPDLAQAVESSSASFVRSLAEWSNGRSYLNFAEHPVDPSTAFDAGTWDRLTRVKATADPDDRFVANHAIPGARR